MPAADGVSSAADTFSNISQDDIGESPAAADHAFGRLLRTERYSINVYSGRRDGELYDLQDDPGQLRNAWADPAYSTVKSELLKQLVDCSAGATFDLTNLAMARV